MLLLASKALLMWVWKDKHTHIHTFSEVNQVHAWLKMVDRFFLTYEHSTNIIGKGTYLTGENSGNHFG